MVAERRGDMRREVNCENRECRELDRRLRAIDFALVETTLYLDAYPDSCEALAYYHKLIQERESLAADYTKSCGPITHRDNRSQTSWQWVKTPWPWEYDAN